MSNLNLNLSSSLKLTVDSFPGQFGDSYWGAVEENESHKKGRDNPQRTTYTTIPFIFKPLICT